MSRVAPVLTLLAVPMLLGVQSRPLVDYHQHLVSPAAAARSTTLPPISAADLLAALDPAGIRRALVLSVAYQYSNPNRPPVDSEYAVVRAETDAALGVFVDAVERRDGRMANVFFDASAVAQDNIAPERAARIAERIRALGLSRVLYGSDAATREMTPKRRLEAFYRLPLTEAEFRTIASNVAPYMK